MKYILHLFPLIYFPFFLSILNVTIAQENGNNNLKKNITVKASEKVLLKSTELQDATAEMNTNIQGAGNQINATVQNVKSIIKVFDPILKLQLKAKTVAHSDSIITEVSASESSQIETQSKATSLENGVLDKFNEEVDHLPESSDYNSDGSANLGNQNHKQYGCFIDVMSGKVMDEIDASVNTAHVDLIFTATDYFGSAPMYALLTPAYVKNDLFSNYYFRGPNFKDANIPIKQWDKVNESEIALTTLTSEKFERIQYNTQLMSVITQVPAFKNRFESRTKLSGKVFAIKTKMGNRQAYGLLLIIDQFGTTGENGYLRVKLKVSGFDNNGDGIPDASIYK